MHLLYLIELIYTLVLLFSVWEIFFSVNERFIHFIRLNSVAENTPVVYVIQIQQSLVFFLNFDEFIFHTPARPYFSSGLRLIFVYLYFVGLLDQFLYFVPSSDYFKCSF